MSVHGNEPDPKRIVAFLAEESRLPIDDVSRLYEHERAELAAAASVTSFVDIFAIRNVQAILRMRSHESNG